MATLTVEIPDALKERIDHEVACGRYKDSSTLVQMLLEIAMREQWRSEIDRKLDEALDEIERGDVVPWKKGDCAKMGREYLAAKRAREAKS